ncbi:MAG: hypothetical protein WBA23_09415 [Tunicatimonas sp.]|uniref:hypothetical protein n=1 Tax=Tunicatimonas sp. TaxID=1940096 RepID=UPI003C732993
MKKRIIFCLAFFILLVAQVSHAQWRFNFESGVVFSEYNDVRVPGDAGTFFSLDDDLSPINRVYYRLRLQYTLNNKHTFSALFAPLTVNYEGEFNREVTFLNQTFLANTPVEAAYQFNSYRLTYRYEFARKGRFQWGIGATAKIRDASIQLRSANRSEEKTNVGFVPLINFRAEWFAKERLSIVLVGDALASPQGRAEDVLLAAYLYPNRRVTLKAGYRILEGGANNDEVYNFNLLHYAVIGGIVNF